MFKFILVVLWDIFQGVCLKMRSHTPCCLINTSFYLGIDDDEYFHVRYNTDT